MFDLYRPKQGSDDSGDDRSDKISDSDNEIDAMDKESFENGGLVGSKEGDNDLDSGINGDTNVLKEVKEFVRAGLASATIDSAKEKLTEIGDVPTITTTTITTTTTTTTEEAIQKIPAVEHFFNYSNPTKEFESFK